MAKIDPKKPKFKSEDRDQIILEILNEDINHANSHLGGDLEVQSTRPLRYWSESDHERGYTYWSEFRTGDPDSGSISLVTAPAWGVIFPPYSIARLSSLLRHYGFRVFVHDTNVETYHYIKNNHDINYWEGRHYYAWERPVFDDEVFPLIKPVLDQAVDDIIADGTDVVGFSLYLTNLLASMYMISRLKALKPKVKVIVGGPESFNDWFEDLVFKEMGYSRDLIDFRIQGEGEQELLTLLENIEQFPERTDLYTFGGFQSKLDLNQLPFPDYTDFNLSLYEHTDGASIETSRGCVAQCSFCAETWFWKYRWRDSDRVIEEMKHQMSRYGIRRFWFVDSLANGNFKEFKRLVERIIEERMNIRWNSYARCDGRMDLELFEKIAASGCVALSFGVESGSEKVLDDMKKKIKVWEIENNLRDGAAVGMKNHVNWVVGFPTEGPAEFLHSLHVLHNARNWIYAISPGMTCGDAPFSDINRNWQDYDLQWVEKPWDSTFMSNWYTRDYRNTIVHRFIRLKFMNIWLRMMVDHAEGTVNNAQGRPDITTFYEFTPGTPGPYENYIPQRANQDFGVFTGETPQAQFAASLANEYLPFMWVIHRTYGAYSFTMRSDLESDLSEFGGFITSPYYADVFCEVDDGGNFTFRCRHRFDHATTREDPRVVQQEIPREDMTFDWHEFELTGNISQFDGEQHENATKR
jgi:radical SAM superfamily enzyme YgiQ (UPF0313 family)